MESVDQITAITNGQTNPIPSDTPVRFSTAMQHCWFKDPDQRPSAKQLAVYLADESEESTLSPAF